MRYLSISKINISFNISGKIAAYDKIWVFGDEFAFQSLDKSFLHQPDSRAYLKEQYEVSGFLNSQYNSVDQNMISRMRNLMINAIQKQVLLPKMILVVMDDDLIRYIDQKLSETGWAICFQKLLNSIMTEYDHMIETHKEYLPAKSKRWGYPHMLWIMPPFHDCFNNNSQRIILAACIENAAKFHSNTTALELKKIWDPHNHNYFVSESDRYTADGLTAYWNAVDKTAKYCDTILLKKLAAKRGKIPKEMPRYQSKGKERYRWTSKDYRK